MSFILKALKKLEQEKAARQAAPADLETAILAGSRSDEKSSFRPRKAGILFLIFVAGGGVTYLAMHLGSDDRGMVMNHAIIAGGGERKLPPGPGTVTAAAPQPAKTKELPPSVASRPAKSVESPLSAPQPAAAAKESPPSDAPQARLSDRNGRTRRHRQIISTDGAGSGRHSAAEAQPAPSLPHDEAPVPAGLKVSGIAIQDDPGKSVAVINGALIKKGMSVNGARVEAIFPDRVRFSSGGGTFQVYFSK